MDLLNPPTTTATARTEPNRRTVKPRYSLQGISSALLCLALILAFRWTRAAAAIGVFSILLCVADFFLWWNENISSNRYFRRHAPPRKPRAAWDPSRSADFNRAHTPRFRPGGSMKCLFSTEPHGEHALTQNERESEGYTIGNQIFVLSDTQKNHIAFTGEELTSLATQWLKYAREKGGTA